MPTLTRSRASQQLADSGIEVCGYGVGGSEDDDEEHIRSTSNWPIDLGATTARWSSHPENEGIHGLSVADEFDRLAIHNHGPGATYSTVEEVASVLDPDDPHRSVPACRHRPSDRERNLPK